MNNNQVVYTGTLTTSSEYNNQADAQFVPFKKFDSGKLKYSLFPDVVLRDVIKIMMFGAEKYGADNWKQCEDDTRYYDALRRHVDSWRDGEYLDPESNMPHLAHALCNLVFLHYLTQRKHNDTPKPSKTTPTY